MIEVDEDMGQEMVIEDDEVQQVKMVLDETEWTIQITLVLKPEERVEVD